MKQIKILIVLLFAVLSLQAQTSATIRPAAKLNVSVASGSDPYTLTVAVLDDLSRFSFSDFGVGDSVYLIDGSDLLIYVVTSKLTSPNRLVVDDVNNTGISAPTGQGAIVKSTPNYKLPFYISGLRDDLRSMMMNRLSQLLDSNIATAGGEIYRYVGTSGVAPAVTAAAAGTITAQNTVGEVYTWNPATNLSSGAWSIVSGGGGSLTANSVDSTHIKPASIAASDAGQSLIDTIKTLSKDTFSVATMAKREIDYVEKFENVHKHQFYKWNNSTQILEVLTLVNDTTAIYRKWWNLWTPIQANRDSFLTLQHISKVKISQVTNQSSVPTIISTYYDYKYTGYNDLAITARKNGTAYGAPFFPHHGIVTAGGLTVNIYADGAKQTTTVANYTYCSKIEIEQKTKMIIPVSITGVGIDTLFDIYNLTTILPTKFNTKTKLKAYQDIQVGTTYTGMTESDVATHVVDGYGNMYSRTQASDFSLPKNDQYTSFLMIDTNAIRRDFVYGISIKNPYSTLRQSKVGFRRTASGQGEKVWYIANTGKLYGAVRDNTGGYEKWSKDTIWNTELEYITAISDNQYAFPNSISTITQLPNSTVNGENWGIVNNTAWEKTGNVNTSENTNFIGTSDAVGLVVKTNNTERMKIQNNGNININGGNVNTLFSIRGTLANPYGTPPVRFMNNDSTQNLYLTNNTQAYGWGTALNTATGVHAIFRHSSNDILFYMSGAIPSRMTPTGLYLEHTNYGIYNGNSPNTKFWFPTSVNHAAISTNTGGEMLTVKETNVGISQTNPLYKLDINGTTAQPLRLMGLQAGSTSDSIVTSASGVLKRLSIAQVVNAGVVTQTASPADGATVTIAATTTRLLLQPSSLISTVTIAFPSSPTDGQKLRINVGSPGGIASGSAAVTTTTWSNGTIYGTTPVILTGGDTIDFQWDSANNVWRRIVL